MGFPTAHALAKQEGARRARRLALQPLERLGQQQTHALRGIVLREERLRVDLRQIVNVVDSVGAALLEYGLPRCAGLPQGDQRRHAPSVLYRVVVGSNLSR